MTHRKKILSLLLALVMLLGFSTSALAADTEIEGRLQITKIVQTQEENVPETEFTFALRDPDGRALADYGITVTQNTLTANASASCYLTFTADTAKITEETGWEPTENGYHHVFELTEENTSAAGWSYDPTVYILDIVYSAGDLFLRSYRESVAEGNNCDVVFYNGYETVTTVEIPFVKNVVQGGNTAPGQQLFELEIFDIGNSNTDSYADVTCTARVDTNGAGTYNGNIVISGPTNQVQEYICEGFFVREKNTGAADWTYSDAVYLVVPDGAETGQGFVFYPAEYTTSENGEYYLPAEQPVEVMVFENTYTHNEDPADTTPVAVEIPFTKTVVQGGNTAPGQQRFELEIFDIGNSNTDGYADVTCTAHVDTNGAGTYTGKIVISGPANQVQEYVCEGFFVREKNTGAADWTYSDAVYLVVPDGIETGQGFVFYPAEYTTSENGEYYLPAEQPVETMVFENTYTHNTAPVPVDPPVETPADTIRLPQTGDGSNVVFLLFAAGFGFAGAIWILRKKEALNR